MDRPGCWDFDSDDFEVFDGIEQVDVIRQTAEGAEENPYTCRAVRESPNRNTVAGIAAGNMIWHVNAYDLPDGHEILPSDRIQDGRGIVWVVTRADLAGMLDQWRCDCVKGAAAQTE